MKKRLLIVCLIVGILLVAGGSTYAVAVYGCGKSAYSVESSHKYGFLLSKTCYTRAQYFYTTKTDGGTFTPQYDIHLHIRTHSSCGKGIEILCPYGTHTTVVDPSYLTE